MEGGDLSDIIVPLEAKHHARTRHFYMVGKWDVPVNMFGCMPPLSHQFYHVEDPSEERAPFVYIGEVAGNSHPPVVTTRGEADILQKINELYVNEWGVPMTWTSGVTATSRFRRIPVPKAS